MATLKSATVAVGILAAIAVGGCSSGNGGFLGLGESSPMTTASLPEVAKIDPACAGLTTQISTLRQDGIADRIEKAAAKKYKMSAADLTKADQLTKASADYQAKCGSGPKPAMQAAGAATTNIGSAVTTAAATTPAAATSKAAAAAKTTVAQQ